MRDELDELRLRVNVLTQTRTRGGSSESDEVSEDVRERVERLEHRVSEVRATAGGGDGVTGRQVAEAPAVKTLDKRLGRLEEDVDDLEAYMYDWHEAAETYLRALREVITEKLGVDFSSYLQAAEADTDDEVDDAQ